MSKSKNNKTHKERLNKFKTRIKQMSQTTQNPNIPQLPEVRQIPTWPSNAQLMITGHELEAMQHGLTYVQQAQQALQSVMSRGVLDGTIKVDFQKLNPETLQYEAMTDEEKKPLIEQFEQSVEMVKSQIEAASVQADVAEPSQEGGDTESHQEEIPAE